MTIISTEPRETEAMAITLARMEGKLDNVREHITDLRTEVYQHRTDIVALQSVTQKLESDMIGAETARQLAATAVRAADEARVAAAKAQVDNTTQRWSPAMRMFAVIGAIAAVVGIVYTFYLFRL